MVGRARSSLTYSLVRILQEPLGLMPTQPAEKALEVKLAQADMVGDFLQFRLAVEVGFDVPDGFFDAFVVAAYA